jgi:hypothetical protein
MRREFNNYPPLSHPGAEIPADGAFTSGELESLQANRALQLSLALEGVSKSSSISQTLLGGQRFWQRGDFSTTSR